MAFNGHQQKGILGFKDSVFGVVQVTPIDTDVAHNDRSKAFQGIKDSFDSLTEKQTEVNVTRDALAIGLVENNYEKLSLKYLVKPLIGILMALLFIIGGLVLLPQHDIFKEPYYWWE